MPKSQSPLVDTLRAFAMVCAAATACIGLVVLAGWILGIQSLKSLNPGWVTMKANTALALILTGAALFFSAIAPQHRQLRRSCMLLSLFAGLIALGNAGEYLTGQNFGIDELLFKDDPNPVSTAQPGRMAWRTTLLFLAINSGILLWLGFRTSTVVFWISQLIGVSVVMCALAALVTYLFGGIATDFHVSATPIAYHTAFCFVLLGVGLFFAEPDRGMAWIFSRDDLGGMLVRRMLPVVFFAPILLGWLRYLGEQADLYSGVQGLIGATLIYIVLFSAFVMLTAAAISRLETRRQHADEIQDRVFTMSQDLLYVAGFDGYFKRVNAAFAQHMGFTAEELTSRPYLDFIHLDDRPLTSREADKNAHAQSTLAFENRYIRKDGSIMHLSWSATPYPEEQLIFGSARDITAQKRDAEEIKLLNDRLVKKVDELAAAMKEMEAFSYSVSHDLRAPLRHIDGFIGLLTQRSAGALDEKSLRYLKTITTSSKQMGMLIDGLLAFSRLGRTDLSRVLVDSNNLVREVMDVYKTQGDGRIIHWKVSDLPQVRADATMLRQVWMNLVENALKYSRTRPESQIEIGARTGECELVFFVRDNGVGFDQQHAHKLFGVFQRLHSRQEFEGTGIGLANVYRIIERHGGRVWAEGVVDQGATFFFSLPKNISTTAGEQLPKEAIAL